MTGVPDDHDFLEGRETNAIVYAQTIAYHMVVVSYPTGTAYR